MRKNQKVQSNNVSNNVSVNEINKTQYSINNNDFFNNEITNHVVTVDMSNVTKIDYMHMSRIAMHKKAIKLDMSYEKIVRYDVLFYSKTNDRSLSQREVKEANLYEYCFKNRTSKQLRDVLKFDVASIAHLNNKYNKQQKFYTVSEYKQLVK
jgi:hypothetical protein